MIKNQMTKTKKKEIEEFGIQGFAIWDMRLNNTSTV